MGTCLKIMETFSIAQRALIQPVTAVYLACYKVMTVVMKEKAEEEKKGLDVNLCTVFDAKSFVFLLAT